MRNLIPNKNMQEEQTKRCPFCAEKINIEAIKCKHCGEMINRKKTKKKKGNLLNLIAILVVSFFALMIFAGGEPTPENNNTKINTSAASIQAQGYVKKALKSPSTAKFPGLWELVNDGVVAYEEKTNRYEIVSYVDSQNSFGATIRSNWSVVLKYLGGDDSDIRNWQLEKMIIDNKIVYPVQE